MKCSKCGATAIIKAGTHMAKRAGGRQQKYLCKECGYIFLMPMIQEVTK